MTANEEILELMEGLPDTPTYADAFTRLRPLYNREVAPSFPNTALRHARRGTGAVQSPAR